MTAGNISLVMGRGLPLSGNDIDTDQMIESRYLKMTTFSGMEDHLFESLRQTARMAGGPPHPFDDPRFAGASVLLVGRNFGCGSSREHAPQGLRRFGIRAIIGESFGEIFAGNCLSLGLPCVSVTPQDGAGLRTLSTDKPETEFLIDIRAKDIRAGAQHVPFTLPEGRRQRLLDGGWDSLSQLLDARASVTAKLVELPDISKRLQGCE